jgi:protein-tyrosine phosphatase
VVPLHDRPDAPIYLWFQEVYDFIQTALDASPHNQVYIHCMAGISRSSTLLAAYLMRRHNMTADDAIAYIRDARPQIQPNPGFYGALKLWELNTQQTFARAAARELKETAPTE